ncbi:M20 family metallopeptidase [Olsenella sp. Marseille-P4559]|uniref:M20 family metallopeptidase n=1 Tax=Olsenella sp. Marseille-P4559 TaxID=2364795 RepID=UPI0010320043|nr:M20 family metallopeptidase [Olsenella sp. Marseille-P4559]
MCARRRTDDEATGLTARLVGMESTDPGAFEGAIEQFVHSWLERRRKRAGDLADAVRIEELEALPGRRCIRAVIPTAGPADATSTPADLTLLCHMDTVRVGAGWGDGTPALSPTLRDGELYGRGSCDMKGGLACALLAFSDALDEVGRRGCLPAHSLAIVCTVDEEDRMRGSEAAIRAGWLGAAGWVLDTEPTDGRARGSHKGRTWYAIDMHGATAHASTPWRGADAIAAMAEAICHIRAAVAALPTHPELGRSTVTFGQVEGGYSPYVVPDECHVTIDMRLVPPTGSQAAERVVQEAVAIAEASIPGTHADVRCAGDRPPIELDPASPLLAALARASEEAWGIVPATDVFTGYTDSAVVAGTCGNPTCLSYGPGSLELAHKPNEHVPVADLARVRAVLSRLAADVLWG